MTVLFRRIKDGYVCKLCKEKLSGHDCTLKEMKDKKYNHIKTKHPELAQRPFEL